MPRQRHTPLKSLVGFLVGDVLYAVRIELVREIVKPLPIVPLPRAPFAVRGVAEYRGFVVPVIDLRERFGLPPHEATRNKWLIVNVGTRVPEPRGGNRRADGVFAALVADSVSDVFGARGQEMRPPPALGPGDQERALEGVSVVDDQLVFVLDVQAFAPTVEASIAPRAAGRGGET